MDARAIALTTGLLISASIGAAESQFTKPDMALAHYIKSLNSRDLAGINTTLLNPVKEFNFSNSLPVERYRVVKRIRYTEKHVREYRKGIGPSAAVGDIELHVEELLGGKPYMFSYNLRETPAGWKIVDFVMWGQQ
jgi:hypothetical protein